MSKSTRSAAVVLTPARVREMHREGLLKDVPAEALPSLTGGPQGRGRGRVHKAAVAAALAVSPKGSTYGEKTGLDTKTVEVPMFSPKTGRAVKPVVKTLSEVRAAAGIEGKKGRISRADLAKAAKAFGSGDQKVTAPKAPAKAKTTKAPAKGVSLAKTPKA